MESAGAQGVAPVLLLPGTLCDERVFAPITGGLSRAGWVAPLRGAESVPEMARRILGDAPSRFALCGFSSGAIVALEIAAQAPARVERLALIGCNPGPLAPEAHQARREAPQDSFLDWTWNDAVSEGNRTNPALRATLDAMVRDTLPEVYRQQTEMVVTRPDSRPRLSAISAPTLVLCGAEDRICPPSLSEQIAASIPGARLVIVADAGHYVTLERPDAVTSALNAWLDMPSGSNPKELS